MDAPLISVAAGLLGSALGGSATIGTSWVVHKTLNRRELLRDEIGKRETAALGDARRQRAIGDQAMKQAAQ